MYNSANMRSVAGAWFISFCRRTVTFSLLLGISFAPCRVVAQAGATGSKVENLYREAKEAQARGDQVAAVAKYESILKIAPRLGAAYNNLGLLYFQQRNFQQAADILEKGLTVDPKMSSASALLGISLFQLGKYPEARPRLEAALHANPKDDNVELFLANDLIKLGELQSAAVHLQNLSRRQPQDQEAWYLLGKIYMQLSEQALSKMNAIDPNSVLAHEMSGEIMESMKNYDGAIVEYKKAIEVAPRQPGAHYKLGDLYWSLSQWDNATAEFQAELANDPANCMAQWKVGNTLVQQSVKPEEALATVEKALAMCPSLSEARLDRGRLLLRLHREQEAVSELQRVAKATPNDPMVHFSLAQAFRALGKREEAQVELEKFRKLDAAARAATADQAQQAIKNKEGAH
jgi:tetratricopeptide (TPR) repeat protein